MREPSLKPLYLPKIKSSLLHILLYFVITLFVFTLIDLTAGYLPVLFGFADEPVPGLINRWYVAEITSLTGFTLFLCSLKMKYSLNIKKLFSLNSFSLIMVFAVLVTTIGVKILGSELDNLLRVLILNWDNMKPSTDEPLWQYAIRAIIIAPVWEELFFRGLLLRGYLQHHKRWTAILFSALLFGVIHMNLPQMILCTFSGIFLGWIYARTHSLLLPILIHAFGNGLVVFSGYLPPVEGFTKLSENSFQPFWFNLIGGLCLIGGMVILNKLLKREKKEPLSVEPSTLPENA